MIPVARYRFDCVAQTPLRLPEYAGSALRGAFGHALKRTVCVTRERDCKACALYRSCAYPAIFEPPPPLEHKVQKFSQIPAPYIVEPPDWGEQAHAPGDAFHFHFVLIGRALKHLPLVVLAWQRALAHGVGPGDGRARLEAVKHCAPEGEATVWQADEGELHAHDTRLPEPPPVPAAVQLRLHTPLRLQHEGRPLRPRDIRADRLLVGLVKRAALIHEFHGGQALELDFSALAERAAGVGSTPSLTWRDWTRHSSRQQQDMKLGGCIGDWRLAGDLAPFWPAMHAGQWLHVGKNATFGLGRYSLHSA